MPFAPIILDKVSKIYRKPKNLESPFMTIGFKTTKRIKNMIAAVI